jgi:hypothetical protein
MAAPTLPRWPESCLSRNPIASCAVNDWFYDGGFGGLGFRETLDSRKAHTRSREACACSTIKRYCVRISRHIAHVRERSEFHALPLFIGSFSFKARKHEFHNDTRFRAALRDRITLSED